MNMRKASAIPAFILLPLIAFGQLQTPAAEADQALRARVTEFLQYHVDGNFRKAYEMVADDTKDEYFNTGKTQLKSFKIDAIKFTDNFTKATVTAMLSKTMAIVGLEMAATIPSTTTWKIENGKWVWYNDVKVGTGTLMDPSRTVASDPKVATSQDKDTGGGLPKDLNEKTIAAAAQDILQQVSVDKREVTLAANKPSEDKVVFHNGLTGSVQVELSAPEIPGFSVKLEQAIVRAGGDVPIVFRFEPSDPGARRDPIAVQLLVQPLNQPFMIRVNFATAGSGTAK
jgi:hypothetical protein